MEKPTQIISLEVDTDLISDQSNVIYVLNHIDDCVRFENCSNIVIRGLAHHIQLFGCDNIYIEINVSIIDSQCSDFVYFPEVFECSDFTVTDSRGIVFPKEIKYCSLFEVMRSHITELPMFTYIPDEYDFVVNISKTDITDLSSLSGVHKLTCSECNVTDLSMFGDVEILECDNCFLLTKLPEFMNIVKELDTSYCPLLKTLPKGMISLEYLNCAGCVHIELPEDAVNITTLFSEETNIKVIPRYQQLEYYHYDTLPDRIFSDLQFLKKRPDLQLPIINHKYGKNLRDKLIILIKHSIDKKLYLGSELFRELQIMAH
jgi:hypothetical protein